MGKASIIGFVIYLMVGIYLLNVPFDLIPLPGFVEGVNDWVVFFAGILVIIGGINYLRASRRVYAY